METTEENNTTTKANFESVSRVIEILDGLDDAQRAHVWNTVSTWFKFPLGGNNIPAIVAPSHQSQHVSDSDIDFNFSDREELSAKDFLNEKLPTTDVERIACLAYYLTHYQGTSSFKTSDLTRLNTEAAQRKFANASETAKNALKGNYLAASSKKGFRQLSAMGEQYVNALPNREEASTVRKRMAPRTLRRQKSK